MIANKEKGCVAKSLGCKAKREGKKAISALLRGITSKNRGDFCLNCFHYFATENKLQLHERVCKNKDFL